MRRFIFFLLAALSLLNCEVLFAATPDLDYSITEKIATLKIDQVNARINDKDIILVAPARELNGRTLVPLRFLENFGLTVTWDDKTATAKITDANHTVEVTPDKNNALIDREEIPLDVPAKLMEGRIYVPLRFVGENFGADVQWDDKTKTVTVTYKKLLLTEYNLVCTLPPGYSVKQINSEYVELMEKDENGIIVIEPFIKDNKDLNKVSFAALSYDWKQGYDSFEIITEIENDVVSGLCYFDKGLINISVLKLMKDQVYLVNGYYPQSVFSDKMPNDLDIIIFTLEPFKQTP